jgi:hypothetical protein
MTPTTRKKGPVQLRFDDGQVFVTPKSYDHFMVTARKAVEALQRVGEVEEWVGRFFDEYIPTLHQWSQERTDEVAACYVTLPPGKSIKVFVVSKGNYDPKLGEEISQLELRLADIDWSSDVAQLPSGDMDELQTFFNPDDAIEVYAQTEPAPREGES